MNIRPVRQPTGKPWCGPACVQMVLAYHGIRRSQPAIVAKLPMNEYGIRPSDLGTYLLGEGFCVTIRLWTEGMQPRLMSSEGDSIPWALTRKLNGSANAGKKDAWKTITNGLLKFHRAGGRIILEPTQAAHIEDALRKKEPPIVNLNPRLLFRSGQADVGHYVVPTFITGRDSQTTRPMIVYLDPFDGREEDAYLDAFMHACHLWAGTGIFVSPWKK